MKEEKTKKVHWFTVIRLLLLAAVLLILVKGICGNLDYYGNTETTAAESQTQMQETSQGPEYAETPEIIEANIGAEFDSVIQAIEGQMPDCRFYDMPEAEIQAYLEPLSESYVFRGRTSEEGGEYLIGIAKDAISPVSGLVSWELSTGEAGSEEEFRGTVLGTTQEEEVYRLDGIHQFWSVNDGQIIVMETGDSVRSLYPVFRQEPWTTEGHDHLMDLAERGVTVMPPVKGGFVCVRMMHRGMEETILIPLTDEELAKIQLLSSTTTISGLSYYQDQEDYQQNEQLTRPVPLSVVQLAKEKCDFQITDVTEIYGLEKAYLCAYRGEEYQEAVITDPDQLAQLEKLLSASQKTAMGGCPYTGILELTRDDGTVLTLQLATDSCDGFILGSYECFTPGEEGTRELWDLFPQVRDWLFPEVLETEGLEESSLGNE